MVVVAAAVVVVVVVVVVARRSSGGKVHTVGSINRERSFSKGLKREERNWQQRGVKRAQRPRGISIDAKGQKYMVACCSEYA